VTWSLRTNLYLVKINDTKPHEAAIDEKIRYDLRMKQDEEYKRLGDCEVWRELRN
jgi:hypothetical protein